MKNKEYKIVLVESEEKYHRCEDCIFFIGHVCKELLALDCDTMRPDDSKKYHWELEEIKKGTL